MQLFMYSFILLFRTILTTRVKELKTTPRKMLGFNQEIADKNNFKVHMSTFLLTMIFFVSL